MNRQLPKNYYSGLSGLQLPFPKYQFPPEHQDSSRLTYYATLFNSIEINSSFYQTPMKATVARWAATVPDDFTFTFKLVRDVTHTKGLPYDRAHITRFIETISAIGTKRACILVQFPPSLTNSYLPYLIAIIQDIKSSDPSNSWNLAVEFRNRSWYNEDVYELLSSHEVALVKHDIPKSITPRIDSNTSFVYVRFHGPTGNYGESYTEAFLQEYSEHIHEWLAEGKKVFVYFNNTKGDAFNNLATLNSMIIGG